MKTTRAILMAAGIATMMVGVGVGVGCRHGGGAAAAPANLEAVSHPLQAQFRTQSEGTFTGLNDHIVTGTAKLVRANNTNFVVFEGDFTFDGAPDPRVGLGNGGTYDESTTMSALNSDAGYQVYRVPATVNPSRYSEVYIWCEQFSVPLGVAGLN